MSRPVSPDEYAKTISRNAHYIAVFKNHWDQTCIQTLFFQIYATVWRDAFEVYNRWPLNRLGIWWSILIRQRPGNLRYVPTIDRYFKRRRTCADASTTTIPQMSRRRQRKSGGRSPSVRRMLTRVSTLGSTPPPPSPSPPRRRPNIRITGGRSIIQRRVLRRINNLISIFINFYIWPL